MTCHVEPKRVILISFRLLYTRKDRPLYAQSGDPLSDVLQIEMGA